MMPMEEMMLELNSFSHNHHPFGVKMVAKKSDAEFRYQSSSTYYLDH